ncbi:hypothetical protein BRM1_13795 [Brevibacterium sp. BRM-1]|uniref:hypothetical protein n=1 Tax=Brevibacterium sp. BRM-1 TaxID=2999062 RepID=UPI00228017D5|nr:hypothetical protein [Brevibacterium sp. BRM-1]WAL40273.1 hypothetical protein BRM1_13795 [Brevibacterium sp. BRM-1]
MEILRTILVFLHLLGMAIIVGGYFANIKAPKVIPGMLHGAYLQLITGIALFGLLEAQGAMTSDLRIKYTVKVALGLLVAVFAFLGNRREKLAARTAAEVPVGAGAPGAGPAAGEPGGSGGSGEPGARNPSAPFAHLTFGAAVLAVIVAVFWV